VLKEKLEKPMTEETNPETPPLNPEEGLTPSANERFNAGSIAQSPHQRRKPMVKSGEIERAWRVRHHSRI